jgi:hypothetical protein
MHAPFIKNSIAGVHACPLCFINRRCRRALAVDKSFTKKFLIRSSSISLLQHVDTYAGFYQRGPQIFRNEHLP